MKFIFKIFLIILSTLSLILILFGSIIGIITIYKANNAFLPLKEGYNPIKIYDNNNNLIATDSIYYTYTSLNDISKNAINAFIASEDRDFYKHNGFNTKRIIKSIKINVTQNGYKNGASTITQQYVKNVFLNNEKTIKRKINELSYAIELERKYSKDQILEAYLNSILFGGRIYGIGEASNYYFNKSPKDLSISEGAYLAGMIQAPNKYNAYKNPILATERKNTVLKCMLEEKYITLEEYNKEKNIDIKDLLKDSSINNNEDYLIQYIDYLFKDKIIIDAKEIYTYLDKDIQKDLYLIAKDEYKIINNNKINLAIVVIDNKTNGIKGLLTNRKITRKSLDYATIVKHQPGSTIKPILDYGPAIEYYGYTPASIIIDEPYNYSNGEAIKNYDNRYLGPITLRYALKDSRNIPALKLYQKVNSKSKQFANNLGININNLYEADCIGGATNGYTILELANAYSAFANLGKYKKATPIKKAVTSSYTYIDNDYQIQCIKPTTAWLINNILHDVFINTSYDLKNTYLMAKSGQTNYDKKTKQKYNIPDNASKDSLLMAYTKDLTIGIWVGFEKNDYNTFLDKKEKAIARNIMKILMNKYALDNQYYDIIPGIKECSIEIYNNTAYLANDGYIEYFENGTEPLAYANKLKYI